ncbi:hypothetical protein GY45DRAFT_166857 [Cubamyces sp. BRFM 1775]|nr:hypothetical protein GY45DRAFT_166857 [Cubamyces sp. BRFM 1775]
MSTQPLQTVAKFEEKIRTFDSILIGGRCVWDEEGQPASRNVKIYRAKHCVCGTSARSTLDGEYFLYVRAGVQLCPTWIICSMLQTGTVPFKTAGMPRTHCENVPVVFMPEPAVGIAPAPELVPIPLLIAVPFVSPTPVSAPLDVVLDVLASLTLVLFAS